MIFRCLVAAIALSLAGCETTTPFGSVPSIEAERKLGEESIPAFLKAKGGVYRNREVTQYLDEITKRLSKAATIPEGYKPLSVKVLDTSVPSAYALPGGAIFVSRGIVAMSNSESQLAGVIAHEIGHVMARHIAEGIAANQRLVTDIVRQEDLRLRGVGARSAQIAIIKEEIEKRLGDITSFSREQELEADRLGVEIMTAAGYDPSGFGDLLQRLEKWQQARINRIGVGREKIADLARRSHYPKINERVAALGTFPDARIDEAARDRLMRIVDGVPFDDLHDGGFIRDGVYRNSRYRVAFDVPEKVFAEHGRHLTLVSADGIVAIRFDTAEDVALDDILERLTTSRLKFTDTRKTRINNLSAITAKIRNNKKKTDIAGRVTIFDLGTGFASVTGFSEAGKADRLAPIYNRVVDGFRQSGAGDYASRRRYKARRAAEGETVAGVAAAAGFDSGTDAEGQFRLLNGLGLSDSLEPGAWVKVIE